ncbi:glutamate decarboxylase [Malassezia yamatoensis]|uniref:Glutamate decarboxylase n=1 Tax=Malassezia yamatoensis TaxID=253288 RepID=A0AAJ5YZU9_9BASI|nr:glutamate decarboxylase [Malassezia yamatoensis]
MQDASPLHEDVSSEEYARIVPEVCDMIQEWMRAGEDAESLVTPYSNTSDSRAEWHLELHEEGVDDKELLRSMQTILQHSVNPWTDRFLAKLYTAPTVTSMCGDMLLSAINASVHVFSASPALSLVEEECVRKLCDLYGFGTRSNGVSMPGGSASNTLAVQTALSCAFHGVYRTEGIAGQIRVLMQEYHRIGTGARPTILTGADSHFSIDRAALASGLGKNAVVHVESDAYGRMRVDALERLLKEMTKDPAHPLGMPFFVNATSGTTVLGAFDDLQSIAKLCKEYGCWLHVDASWGGPAIFSETLRKSLFRGVEFANSLTVNPHKLLNVTHQCSFLLVKDGRCLTEHAIHAGYLFHETQNGGEHRVTDRATMTLGCGRRGEALKLFLTWRKYGTKQLGKHLDHGVKVAQQLLDHLRINPHMEVGPKADPLFLQICFRPRRMPGNLTGSDATHAVCARLQSDRRYAVDFAPTTNGDYLRLVVHPRTPTSIYFALIKQVTAKD